MTEGLVLDLEEVVFGYAGERVLDGLELQVARGDFVALLGANGSGKSTLLRVALGLLRPESGVVRLFGAPLTRLREWWRVGYVPQQVSAHLREVPATVRELVLSGRTARLGLLRRPGAGDRAAVTAALERVGLADQAQRAVQVLSGGQLQRALIARALAGEPELLLLDEPTAGVDEAARAAFFALLEDLHRTVGLTIIFVTHHLGEVAPLATRIVSLERGRLVLVVPHAAVPTCLAGC